ncbi:hypothetical protein ACOMHN_010297 [Nucella lapillus]
MALNGVLITNSENTYPYRAMLETLLTYGPDAQKCGYLECCLFASDTPGHMDATTGDDNRGLKHRRNASARSQTMDLMDRFSRGYGIFCFDLTPSLVDGEQFELVKSAPLRLELKFAKALPNPVVVLVYGELDGIIEVDKSRQVDMALNGVLITNSENTYPYRAMLETLLTYGPDAQKCGYLECCLFASDTPGHMDATTGDDNRGLKHRRNASARSQTMDLMDRFSRGYGIFCFDLTPSLVDGEQFELVKSAPLRLELKFAKALPNPVVVLVYGELDGIIEVDKSRQVLTDFAV